MKFPMFHCGTEGGLRKVNKYIFLFLFIYTYIQYSTLFIFGDLIDMLTWLHY